MNALYKLQQAFAADLWGEELQHMEGLILDDQLSAARQFNVYRNNFRISLTDALADIFPVVEQLVGREFFGFMADRYIRTHPSRSGNLHNLGCAMAEFLSHFKPVHELPYLPDVARLEWAYHEVFHAAAPAAFEPKALATVAVERYRELHFDLGPACRLVRSSFPIFRIWQVIQPDYVGDNHVNLEEGPEAVLVVRPELEVELRRVDSAESAFLKALDSGNSLGAAVAEGLKNSVDFDLQSVLARHLSSGTLLLSQG
jgi:hypothetical protein